MFPPTKKPGMGGAPRSLTDVRRGLSSVGDGGGSDPNTASCPSCGASIKLVSASGGDGTDASALPPDASGTGSVAGM